jgi:hypothetical protein
MTVTTDTQTVWLDDPSSVVRTFNLTRQPPYPIEQGQGERKEKVG